MRVLIAGGGTGGHIYPAISIGKAVLELAPHSVVEFVGTPAGLETRLVPQAGFTIHAIKIGRLNRNVGLIEQIKTLLMLPYALYQAFCLIKRFKPEAVLGVGGYASGPVVFIAALLGCNTYVWEPNAYPGLANRILARFVRHALVVFDEARQFLKCKKITQVHVPVRKEIEDMATSNAQKPSESNFRILVFGGSQGARAINNALSEAVIRGGDWLKNVQIVHQTGVHDFKRISELYRTHGVGQVQVLEYLNDMPERYAYADIVISRAGTGTISELAACGKAAILVPLPSAADDHQTKNAQALLAMSAARLLKQSEMTPDKLIEEISYLKTHREVVHNIEANIRRFHKPRAANEIANIILNKS